MKNFGYYKIEDEDLIREKIKSLRNQIEAANISIGIASGFFPASLIMEQYEIASLLGIITACLLSIDIKLDKNLSRYYRDYHLCCYEKKQHKILKRDTAFKFFMSSLFRYGSIIISLTGMTFSSINFCLGQIPVILTTIIASAACSSIYADLKIDYKNGAAFFDLNDDNDEIKVKKLT